MPPSGVRWMGAEALAKATVMEVYLNRKEGGYVVAAWQSFLVDAVTDTPQQLIPEESARDPRDARLGWRENLSWVGSWLLLTLFVGAGLAGFGYSFWALLQ